MTRGKRIVLVTAGLAAAGAILGAVSGAATLGIVGLIDGSLRRAAPDGVGQLMGLGAGFGALLGLVLGPAAAWLLMRTVPLGRALFGTALGTVAGGVAGLLIGMNPLVLPLAGFFGSALLLRMTANRGSKSKSLPPAEEG